MRAQPLLYVQVFVSAVPAAAESKMKLKTHPQIPIF